jgi:hypothetical protein
VSDVIALVFDLDDTLLPDSTTMLLESKGIDAERFWKVDAKALLDQGYDPTIAYLNLILDNVGDKKPLGNLTIQELHDFGATLEDKFFPGVNTLARDLRDLVKKISRDIAVELYIVSGGLQDIMDGSSFINETFEAIYGCQFGADENGVLKKIKRTITFTEKTRYLFEINKGIRPPDTVSNQYLVNKFIPEGTRRVPFRNIIYVGDGLTDIPSFSLVQKNGGTAFGIFKPNEAASAKRAFLEFLKTGRVVGTYSPKFAEGEDLGGMIRAAVTTTASRIIIDRGQAENRFA